MKPAPFSYYAPTTLDAALEALASADPPRILAGGQSLVPMLNLRLAPTDTLLDVGRIAELRAVTSSDASVRYGATTTHAAFEDQTVPDCSNGLMAHVARRIAYRAIRTRGTIGGALALADPAADWIPALVALEAKVNLVSKAGQRDMLVGEFVSGPYITALLDGELILSVEVPRRQATERWGYYKVMPKVGEYAESLAITLVDRTSQKARLVLGATDGAPLVLPASARLALDRATDGDLVASIRSELTAQGREFSAAQLILHSTTCIRALKGALQP